jgi:hypothetical protein
LLSNRSATLAVLRYREAFEYRDTSIFAAQLSNSYHTHDKFLTKVVPSARSASDFNVCVTDAGLKCRSFVESASRGVCVLRRTGPPHGGAHVGRIAAAQWACSGDLVTDSCARRRNTSSATSRQTIIVHLEPTGFRRSSWAPSASQNMAVADHQVVAFTRIGLNRVANTRGIGRHSCAKSRWQE